VVGIKIVRSEEEHEESEGGSSRYPAHRCLEGVAALLDGCGEEGLPCALRILRALTMTLVGSAPVPSIVVRGRFWVTKTRS
jgi:hypothetical protein